MMGLDMYLFRMPRCAIDKKITPRDVEVIDAYLGYEKILKEQGEKKAADSDYMNYYSDEPLPSQMVIDYYRPLYVYRTHVLGGEYGYDGVYEKVDSWCGWDNRWIHDFFITSTNHGRKDCGMGGEITEDNLEALIKIFADKLHKMAHFPYVLTPVLNGKPIEFDGYMGYNLTLGEYKMFPKDETFSKSEIEDVDEDDREFYENSIKTLRQVIKTTDFNNYMIGYYPSW